MLISRRRFRHLGAFQQKQWILDYIHSNTNTETNETVFFIASKLVCLPVWLAALGLSKSRFYEVKKSFSAGVLFFEQLVSPKSRHEKSNNAVAWMRLYFGKIGDHMPDRLAIHLPSFLTQSSVFLRMKEEFESTNQPAISSSQFYSLWATEFPRVSIPKVITLSCMSILVFVLLYFTMYYDCLSILFDAGKPLYKV